MPTANVIQQIVMVEVESDPGKDECGHVDYLLWLIRSKRTGYQGYVSCLVAFR